MASTTIDKRTGNIVIRAYAGINPSTHKPYYASETIDANASDAEIEAAIMRVTEKAALTKGDLNALTIQTVIEYYLACCEADGMEATTLASYKSYTRRHIVPRIGAILFDKADSRTFSMFYRDLRREKSDGGAGLSQTTVKKISAFLSGCFSRLEGDGIIAKNPVSNVKVAEGRSPEAKPLSPDDFAKLRGYLLDVMHEPVTNDRSYESHTFATILWVALHTGLRRGELSGLQRLHLTEGLEESPSGDGMVGVPALRVARVIVQVKDPKGDRLIVKDYPKGKKVRTVILDSTTALYLSTHDLIQCNVLIEHGISINDETPLFAHADGSIFTPAQLTDLMRALVKDLGLSRHVHLHTLRHTHATYLLEKGEPIRRVQERLGHKSVQTTLELYGHVLPGSDAETARRFARTSEDMMKRPCSTPLAQYAPLCPRTGKTCERFQ